MRFWQLITALIAAGLLAGCSASKPTTDQPPMNTEDQLRAAEASFRPSDHDPLPAHGQQSPGSTLDSTLSPAAGGTPLLTAGDMVQGFRVQAFSSTSIDEARTKKTELEEMFPGEWFYLDYASPSYKIRAGNFINRFEADRFARMMIEKGYADAWTVPERVYKNIGRRPIPPPPPPPQEQPEIK